MDKTLVKWITNGTAAPFYARKEFHIAKEIKRAEANVCGLGQFIFYLNGKKVGDHELDPGWTDYSKLIQYVTFDVTDYLVVGDNAVGAEVGNGWFIKTDEHYTFTFPEFMPPNPNPYKPYGRALVLALTMKITYKDGTEETIEADESFKVKVNSTVMSNVYGSETEDGRMRQEGWCLPGFDDSGWESAAITDKEDAPKGMLMEQFQPAVKVIRSYEAKDTGRAGDREIYDFGQNMSAILEFEVKGRAGDKIYIYPAEKLGTDGDVDQVAKAWVTVDSCITYIIGQDDKWEKFRMKYTYFAGRYIGVETVAAEETEEHEINFRGIKAHAISSAWKTDGTFESDDERYNKIYDMVEKSVEANMVSVHTDCPTIERFAWQEPNHLMAPAIFYMKDGRKLWEKFLLDMRTAQHTAGDYFFDYEGNKFYPGDGLMPSQCPCYIPNVLPVPGMGSFYDIIPWGSTCILGTYWHYIFYGDKKIIEDNYDAGMRYLNYLKTKVTEEGFISHGLGDWGNPENNLARENVETAFLYADTKALAMFAEILEKETDQKELESYAEQVRNNYNERLLVQHPEKGFWCYRCQDHPDEVFMTQAAEALPIYWGLAPDDKKDDIIKAFRYTLEQAEAFVSGEVGLPYIIQTAREYGMNDLIAQFITRTEHPSYYAFVLDGMTTLGEYWETNPRSHCHDMMGHITEWFYNGIAGIQPLKPGFGKVRICPYLPDGMKKFTCTYHSAAGPIRVSVQETEKEICLETEVSENIQAEVDTCNLEQRKKEVQVTIKSNKRSSWTKKENNK